MLSPSMDEAEHNQGLLVNFDYALFLEQLVRHLSLYEQSPQEEQSPEEEQSPQSDGKFHCTVSILEYMNNISFNGLTGNFTIHVHSTYVPNSSVEHSEKHDLESIFYNLLYICTMCQGPGKRWNSGDRRNVYHPFRE
jgi:hypothetical protein